MMRAVGTTAVVAGTATAVSGRVARRQRRRAMEQTNESAPPPAPATPTPPVPAAPTGGGLSEESLARLASLAALRDQGVLTEAEFTDQKTQILSGT